MTPISVIGMMAFFMIARPEISGVISPGPGHRDFEARLPEHTLGLLFHGILEQVEPTLTSNCNKPECSNDRN